MKNQKEKKKFLIQQIDKIESDEMKTNYSLQKELDEMPECFEKQLGLLFLYFTIGNIKKR